MSVLFILYRLEWLLCKEDPRGIQEKESLDWMLDSNGDIERARERYHTHGVHTGGGKAARELVGGALFSFPLACPPVFI